MKKAIGALVASVMLVGLMAAPAVADDPIVITDTVVFTDVNPCTGLEHEITRDFTIKVREHRNNTVLQVDNSVVTSDGYEGTGHETTVISKNVETGTINYVVDNPDTGAKYMVKIHFTFDTNQGELRTERVAFNCVKDS